MQIYLHETIKKYFDLDDSLFEQVMALRGECFRYQDQRLTQRIYLGSKSYFIKQHYGVGWKEIIKNLLQLRLPVVSARNEFLAIQKLQQMGIAVPKIVGYGIRRLSPAQKESFIIMEELTPIISLETYCQSWPKEPPLAKEKYRLIKEVAVITQQLHAHGINHRDLYICHFLLQASQDKLYLIDLHRAQMRKHIPSRWVKKDLSALYFSSKDINLNKRDWYRFMKQYRQKSLRQILLAEKNFWQEVQARGEKIYRDHQ